MESKQLQPHVLIGLDPVLTRVIWSELDWLGREPLILAANAVRVRLKTDREPLGRVLETFPLERLAGHFFYHRPDPQILLYIEQALKRTRTRLKIPKSSPLTTVVVGKHYSAGSALKVASAQPQKEAGWLSLAPFMRSRTLASLVGATLERVDGLEMHWLSEALDERMQPQERSDRYRAVVKKARDKLATTEPPTCFGAEEVKLKLPAIPMIYVRNGPGEIWTELPQVNGRRGPHTESSELIKQFGKARRESKGRLQGVLLKVLGEDLSRHTSADAPMVTAQQLKLARDAELEAVLLDWRHGVIRPAEPTDLMDPRTAYADVMPVYFV